MHDNISVLENNLNIILTTNSLKHFLSHVLFKINKKRFIEVIACESDIK